MSIYRYKALDSNGRISTGFIKAQNEINALNTLTLKNLYIVSLFQIPQILHPLISIFSVKIKNIELIEFTKNLSIMLKAGIPITTALSDIAENISKEKFRRVITDLREMIEKGVSFSEAIAYHSEIFPSVFQYLIKIGEETGRLDKSLDDLVNHFQKIEDLKTAIKRALIYPIFATVASFGAMGFWIVYVLPKIVNAMKDMGIKIPLITQILVEIGTMLQKFYYLIPVIFILLFIFFHIFKKNSKIRLLRSYLSFRLPIFKQIFYTRAVALFCEQMRILMGAGIPIDSAFDMTADVINNELMRKAIMNAKEKIMTGQRISQALKEEKVFPSLMIRLIDVGESSGRLEEQLNFLNEHYTNYLQEYSARLGKVIEPVMIGVIGLFFAIVIVSLLSPLYELISKLGR
ncbi:MAG: type II secretion system F family protein [Thermodesulfovibrio sp.]|nr:type II secretion system F family protein [Thermodesulfovibrio sp.]